MTDRHHLGPAALARAYLDGAKSQEELRGNWVVWVIHRWPSFPLTALCLRLGIGANVVTLVSLALVLMLPVLAVWPQPGAAAWAVAVAGVLIGILDCVDGDLARATGSASARGARLDFVTDMTCWGFLYGAIGLLADGGGPGAWTALALAAAWLRLLARLFNDHVGGAATTGAAAWTPGRIAVAFVSGLSGAIAVLALAAPAHPWVIWLLVLYSLADLADALVRMMGDEPA